MEKEDQIVKNLIKEGFLKEAPEGFTQNVMRSLPEIAISKNKQTDYSALSIVSAILLATGLSLAIIYFVSRSFFITIVGTLQEIATGLIFPFQLLFQTSFTLESGLEVNTLITGTAIVMILLLVFDYLIRKIKSFYIMI